MRDTLTKLSITLMHLCGARSLWYPLVAHLLGECVAPLPLAKATEIGYTSLVRNKQKEAGKQYASHPFPAPELMGLVMDLNIPNTLSSTFRSI